MTLRAITTLLAVSGLLLLPACGGRRHRQERQEARQEPVARQEPEARNDQGGGFVAPRERAAERRDDRADERVEDRSGWDKLGERVVQGRGDKDTLVVTGREGTFSRIKLVVEHSALELWDVEVTFGDGTTFSPGTRLVFGKNSTSRVIDLPGAKRAIRKVEFRYGNLPGGGRAQLELWGN